MDREDSDFEFKVNDKEVFLTITIGEGQLGASFVFRGKVLLVKGGVVIGGLNLGSGNTLFDQTINVDSIVNDVSTQTNRMSVRYVVENGGNRQTQMATHEVQAEGNTCRFVTTLSFKRAS